METYENLSGEMELNIIHAATRVFVLKGRTGASMQDIADEAGINRTLLNYYFRSKDKLFNVVFDRVLNQFIKKAAEILRSEVDILVKLEDFIDLYIRTLLDNPMIPVFILNELSANPQRLLRLVKSHINNPIPVVNELKKAMDEGRIKETDPSQLIISLISMIIFPFAAKSMITGILLNDQGIDFNDFMEKRILFLKDYFLTSIILEK